MLKGAAITADLRFKPSNPIFFYCLNLPPNKAMSMKNLRVAAFRHFIHRRGRCVCIFITAQENKAKQKTSVKSKNTGTDSRDKDEIPFRCCCQTSGYKKCKNLMIITKKTDCLVLQK